jgi:SAM-dependent methyltransferase
MGFVQGVGEQLPLSDMTAHGVLIKEAIDHCYDPAKVFSEVKRVLKPGGVFVLTVTNDKSYFKLLLPWVNRAHKARQTDHLFFFSPLELKKIAEHAGFDRVEVQTYNYLKLPRFLEVILGGLGPAVCGALLNWKDRAGRVFLPNLGGSIVLTAHRRVS